jgi:UDP-N-acetylglucosamine 1-carboxyvinyltransferase
MNSFRINGGKPLSGEIRVSGNKNAILPMIAASLLTDEKITLHNVPDILDVRNMLKAAAHLGVEISYHKDTLTLQAKDISTTDIPCNLCSLIRTSLLFAGPLLLRTGKVSFFPPGGDVIGRRRLDSHFYGLTTLGAELVTEGYPFLLKAEKLHGKELFFDEASVTATEHILMTATLAEGNTIIRNAAAEPHVQDLAMFLQAMGAEISGIGTNTLEINGCAKLHGVEYTIAGDHIEAGSFLAMAAATGGGITVKGTISKHYWMIRRVFERFGIHFKFENDGIVMPAGQKLEIIPDFDNAIPIISDGPWPQYPTDMMSCTIVMATQAKGTALFFEKMFESRMYFVDRLIGMGANAIVCDPHRVVISGPSSLHGVEMSSPDIRAGMAMLIAALCADGISIINNSSVIARGYESIVEKITALGGNMEEIT